MPFEGVTVKQAPSASRAVAFAVVNAFTGLVAFSCGSVMHASIHPALMHDDARCEVELNPPRRLGLLRSFGLGGVEARPIPLDVGVLPIQVNSPSDDSEHDVSCSEALFNVLRQCICNVSAGRHCPGPLFGWCFKAMVVRQR